MFKSYAQYKEKMILTVSMIVNVIKLEDFGVVQCPLKRLLLLLNLKRTNATYICLMVKVKIYLFS